ncbi:DUF262 domain-containing protein [Spiroplasma sp. BIUS-1]|uniref:DUF262 domain-containing protein n=1 Tax=Spiroplasma sp. BIUS-1 TaxID=216964 RepID=UPI0013977928|nr:DUF262 domain-containing protein [Spiroplasma sp. BIUS-1]QHX36776.1 hypothetical protein SBIUS_v1c05230 [Spiroplasma sp. BIUS-1]
MISKNFDFLNQYSKYKIYYADISNIEDSLKSGEKYVIRVDSAKLIEKLLKNIMGYQSYPRTLGDLINEFISYYKSEKNSFLASGVIAALRSISANRNESLHHNEIDFGESDLSFTTKINILQYIRKIFHFVIISFEDSDLKLDRFNDQIYYENLNNFEKIDLSTQFSYDNDQILIDKVSIGDFVLNDKNNFVIPSYQRDYRWTEEECQELINQLIYKYKTNELVYFGTLACKIDQLDNGQNEIRLIDGQQRVTTSLLLFKAFNDVLKYKLIEADQANIVLSNELTALFEFKEKNSKDYSDLRIKEKYINFTSNSDSNQDGLYHILTGYVSQAEFERGIKLFSRSLVIENYKFFKNQLMDYSIENLVELYNYYSNNFVLSCIKFDEENTNEMEVFENLNSKGKELDTFDMIKNYMYNMVDNETFKNRSKEIVDEFKKYFRLNDIPKLKGKKDEQNKKYEEFLFNFLTYKNAISNLYIGKIQKNKKSLLKAFKAFYDRSKISFSEYASVCEELGRYFKIYRTTRITFDYENKSNELYFVSDILKNLSHKDFSIVYFRLIDVYTNSSWNKVDHRLYLEEEDENLKKCLFELEKWVIFLLQVKGTGQSFKESVLIKLIKFTKLYEEYGNFKTELPDKMNKWFSNKIAKTKDNETLLINEQEHALPTREQIIESLKNKEVQDNNIKNVFLLRLENYWLNLTTKANQKIVFKKPTIEHIIPQTPSIEWKEYLSNNKGWNEDLNDIFRDHLNRIGNLLILDNSNNSELSNSNFEKKKLNYTRSESRLAKIPFNSKDENLLTIDYFGFEQVRDRSAKLATLLVDKIYNV